MRRRASARRPARGVVLLLLLLAALALWCWVPRSPAAQPALLATRPTAAPAVPAAFAEAAPLPLNTHADAAAPADPLWREGPLRGTQIDGDWGRWVDGRLQPSRSLRLRFDYLLSGLGTVKVDDLRAWIARQVREELGAAAAGPVLAVWDRYLLALQSASALRRDPADPAAWQRSVAQLGLQRRESLGADWAHAFFAEDERAAADFLARHQRAHPAEGAGRAGRAEDGFADTGALLEPAAASLTREQRAARDAQRLAAFGPDAVERLRAEDAADAAWSQQLAAMRERLAAIAADPQLSPLQRQQAQEAAVTRQYSGTALTRARALLADAP